MSQLYIIAEAAQGYEGSVELSKLLVRSAKMAGANAIKFQVVYADDLAEKGYQYYDLFQSLEMSFESWKEIREFAKQQGIDFIIDVFGEKSCELVSFLKPEGLKIHSTNFFDSKLIKTVFEQNVDIYFSVGGIYPEEILDFIKEFNVKDRKNVHLLYGFQSEPTPIESNHLLRIPVLRSFTGIQSIGFMDHSDGAGDYKINLSVLAMGGGVRIFEKHITLDRHLEMEDFDSALGVQDFAQYTSSLRKLYEALGKADLELSEEEISYRNKALKKVLASRNMKKGDFITENDIKLNRPSVPSGSIKPSDVLGKAVRKDVMAGEALSVEGV